MSGHFEIVQWLLNHRANPNHQGHLLANGWTPLHAAVFSGHVEVSRLLLQYKADIHTHDKNGRTPLQLAGWHVTVARLLREHGVDVNA